MKKIWLKIFITISILNLLILFWYIFAEDSANIDRWDCLGLIQATWGNFGKILDNRSWKNENIYPKESIKRALLNLKSYCCHINTLWSETPGCKYDKEKWLLSDNYPDSKYLYDHLVDIWFRRLDAMEKLLYEKVIPDPIWKEWRDFINNKWVQTEWTTPTDIVPKFQEQRTLDVNYLLPNREDWNYNSQYQKERTLKTQEYSNWPLINRYSSVCEITAYIYWHLWLNLWDYTRKNWYVWCKWLSKNLITRNVIFTKAIVLKKSNKLLYDNMNTYVSNYLSQSKLTKLKETILWIVETFNVVNKKVIKLIKECW